MDLLARDFHPFFESLQISGHPGRKGLKKSFANPMGIALSPRPREPQESP